MLSPKLFFKLLLEQDIDFFVGVPDSVLKPFCNYVTKHVPKGSHLICANEGGAVGVAIGYHLATNKIALTYMQNSGIGNGVNPLLSMADREVYSIPVLMLIGWRGEPGHKDEIQHNKQGRVTLPILKAMEIPYEIITGDPLSITSIVQKAVRYMKENSAPFALVVRRESLESYPLRDVDRLSLPLKREDAIKLVINSLGDEDIVVASTGMGSRELFEIRERLNQGHAHDFLTVGAMGHASQIALGIAMQKHGRRVVCLDGDGAAIMHMGAMAINAMQKCDNFIHIILNNGAHDSVGGQPTVGFDISFQDVARAIGYKTILGARTREEIKQNIDILGKGKGPSLIEIRVKKGYREDLGRPKMPPIENKRLFMEFLK